MCTSIRTTFWYNRSCANRQWFRFIYNTDRDAEGLLSPLLITADYCDVPFWGTATAAVQRCRRVALTITHHRWLLWCALLRPWCYCSRARRVHGHSTTLDHSTYAAIGWLLTLGQCVPHLSASIAQPLKVCIHAFLSHMTHIQDLHTLVQSATWSRSCAILRKLAVRLNA